MKYYLIIISIAISQLLTAQNGNTFTVGMSSGLGMSKNTTLGENKQLDNLSNIHTALNFSYGIKLPKNLSCDLNFSLDNISYFPYPIDIGRWTTGQYLSSNLGAGLRYKIPIKTNFFSLGLSGGFKLMRNGQSSYQAYTGSYLSKTNYQFEGTANPFIKLQFGYEFPLKNKNLIGIDLSFNGAFRPIYSMEFNYTDSGPSSHGTYTYSGNSIHLGVHYTWTKNKKNADIETFLKDSVNRKEAKK